MTCIAYKFPFLAADSRVGASSGRLLFGMTNKIFHGEFGDPAAAIGHYYAGFAGNMGTEHVLVPYVKALLEGDTEGKEKHYDTCRKYIGDKKEQDAFEGIVIVHTFLDDSTKVYTLEPALFLCEFTAPFSAVGCGAEIALGAMAHGASPFEAVHHATVWDGACGYPINGFNVVTGEQAKFQDFEELHEYRLR